MSALKSSQKNAQNHFAFNICSCKWYLPIKWIHIYLYRFVPMVPVCIRIRPSTRIWKLIGERNKKFPDSQVGFTGCVWTKGVSAKETYTDSKVSGYMLAKKIRRANRTSFVPKSRLLFLQFTSHFAVASNKGY